MGLAYLLPFIAGAFYSLGHPSIVFPFIIPATGFFSALLFIYALTINPTAGLKIRFIQGVLYGLGLTILGHHWLPYTLHEFGAIPIMIAFLIWPLFAIIVTPQITLFALLYNQVYRFKPKNYFQMEIRFISVALTWVILENYVPQFFPEHLGHTFFFTAPHFSLVKIFGVSIFSFLAIWIAISVNHFVRYRRFYPLAPLALVVALILNLNYFDFNPVVTDTAKVPLKVRMVQPNVGNYIKITQGNSSQNTYSYPLIATLKEQVESNLFSFSSTHFQDLSELNYPDLIIWPETSYPFPLSATTLRRNRRFRELVETTGATLIFGAHFFSEDYGSRPPLSDELQQIEFEKYANALIALSPSFESTIYQKVKLIPFGETLPFGPFNSLIAPWLPSVSFFKPGREKSMLLLREKLSVVPSICYEILFTHLVRSIYQAREGTETYPLIVNLTNDSWYHPPEPKQHQFLAHWRAVELGIPILRSTNTGITSVLFPNGTKSKELEFNQIGKLDIEVPYMKTTYPSWYARYGNLTLYLMVIMLIFQLWVLSKIPLRNRRKDIV